MYICLYQAGNFVIWFKYSSMAMGTITDLQWYKCVSPFFDLFQMSFNYFYHIILVHYHISYWLYGRVFYTGGLLFQWYWINLEMLKNLLCNRRTVLVSSHYNIIEKLSQQYGKRITMFRSLLVLPFKPLFAVLFNFSWTIFIKVQMKTINLSMVWFSHCPSLIVFNMSYIKNSLLEI